MAKNVLGSVIVDFKSRTAKFEKSTKRVANRLRAVKDRVFSLQGALVSLAGVGGFGLMIKAQAQAIDESAKLSDRLGANIEELNALHRITELSGGSTSKLNKSLEAMSRRIGEAKDGTGEAVDALKKLGLNAEELVKMSMGEQFEAVARGIQKLGTENEKASVAADLMSRQGISLLNTMKMLSDQGLEPTIENLRATGESLNRLDAAKVEQMNDAVLRMKGAFSGIGRRITIEIAEPVANVADFITSEFKKAGGSMRQSIADAVAAAVRGFGSFLQTVGKVVSFIEKQQFASEFGLLGMVIFGKKGAAAGIAISAILQPIVDLAGKMGQSLTMDNSVRSLIAVNNQLKEAREELESLLKRNVNADVVDPVAGRVSELIQQQRQLRSEMSAGQLELVSIFSAPKAAVDNLGSSITSFGNVLVGFQDRIQPIVVTARKIGEEVSKIPENPIKDLGKDAAEAAKQTQKLQFAFESAFENAIIGGQGLRSVIGALIQDIARLVLRMSVVEPLANALSGGVSSLFGGGKITPIDTSSFPKKINPEGSFAKGTDFVPRDMIAQIHKGERIVPARENRAGGGGMNITINAPGADQGTIQRIREIVAAEMIPQAINGSVSAIRDLSRRPDFA